MPNITDVSAVVRYFNPKNVHAMIHTVTLNDDTIGNVEIYGTSDDGGAAYTHTYNVSTGDDFDTLVTKMRETQDPNGLVPVLTRQTTSKEVWINPLNVDHIVDQSTYRQLWFGHSAEIRVTESYATIVDLLLVWENWTR